MSGNKQNFSQYHQLYEESKDHPPTKPPRPYPAPSQYFHGSVRPYSKVSKPFKYRQNRSIRPCFDLTPQTTKTTSSQYSTPNDENRNTSQSTSDQTVVSSFSPTSIEATTQDGKNELGPRSILTDLTNIAQPAVCKESSLKCLTSCAEWYCDVFDCSNPNSTVFLTRLSRPHVSYKHCSSEDQNDALDEHVERRGSFFVSSPQDEEELYKSSVVFPLQNKTKCQNIQITNFERE